MLQTLMPLIVSVWLALPVTLVMYRVMAAAATRVDRLRPGSRAGWGVMRVLYGALPCWIALRVCAAAARRAAGLQGGLLAITVLTGWCGAWTPPCWLRGARAARAAAPGPDVDATSRDRPTTARQLLSGRAGGAAAALVRCSSRSAFPPIMMPTSRRDFIIVNKYAYGLRLPVINRRSRGRRAAARRRGGVRWPVDPSTNFIKRWSGCRAIRRSARQPHHPNGQPVDSPCRISIPTAVYDLAPPRNVSAAYEHQTIFCPVRWIVSGAAGVNPPRRARLRCGTGRPEAPHGSVCRRLMPPGII